jgi:hypothetical protein
MRGCHAPGSGRITAPGSIWPQSTRMVQRKRRPTSNVDFDEDVAGEARRDRLEIGEVTFRGGLWRVIPLLRVGQAGVPGQFYMGDNALACILLRAKMGSPPASFANSIIGRVTPIGPSSAAAPAAAIRCLRP